ncbi:MAG TPA: Hsp20/alpha crystallin family protein [Gemmatimonadaceae bacterium]
MSRAQLHATNDRWDGFYLPFTSMLIREMEDVQERFRRMLGEPSGNGHGAPMIGFTPTVEIAESPEEFTLTAELPGTSPDDITVEFDGGVLTLRGKKEEERRDGDETRSYHLYERTFGAFERSFTFPGSIDEQKITADFKDGVLTVHLPKTAGKTVRGRRIQITKPQ